MGSTVVCFYFTPDVVYAGNLGDSRSYLLRENQFRQVSVDHVEKREGKRKAPLTQHLGINPDEYIIEPALDQLEPHKGDCYLLCSDGVTDMLTDEEIQHILEQNPDTTACVTELVNQSLEHGGKDNITAIVCRVL